MSTHANTASFDLVIIGGGINGCGCAADAAQRGLSVFLCDKGHIASATSSKSSKLIHGGLRYLEYYDFSLVKKALDERQQLLNIAPHLVHPLPFVLPLKNQERKPWMLRAGLFIYDHLSFANRLPHSHHIQRDNDAAFFQPLDPTLSEGFLFYDCGTDDARLTITNAIQAQHHGATIRPNTELISAKATAEGWQLTLRAADHSQFQINAKVVINAAGPWVVPVAERLHVPVSHPISLVKGSHIVTPKLYEGEHAYLLQHHDKRIVFVVPFHGYSMIGTTDIAFNGTPDEISIDEEEIDYLLALVHQYFKYPLTKKDIHYTWSGVRPLLASPDKNPSALSRDYAVEYTTVPAPCVTIYGGKITTYRQLAEHTIDQLSTIFTHLPRSHTRTTPLPGATLGELNLADYQKYAQKKYGWLDAATLTRYISSYGTRSELILAHCVSMADLGQCFAPTFYAKEVDYLCHEEWAVSVENILWIHTKLGLCIDPIGREALAKYTCKIKPNR